MTECSMYLHNAIHRVESSGMCSICARMWLQHEEESDTVQLLLPEHTSTCLTAANKNAVSLYDVITAVLTVAAFQLLW